MKSKRTKLIIAAGTAVLVTCLAIGIFYFYNWHKEAEEKHRFSATVEATIDSYRRTEKAINCVYDNYARYISSMLSDEDNSNYTEEKEYKAFCKMWADIKKQLKVLNIEEVSKGAYYSPNFYFPENENDYNSEWKKLQNIVDSISEISSTCCWFEDVDPTFKEDPGICAGNGLSMQYWLENLSTEKKRLSRIGIALKDYKEGVYKKSDVTNDKRLDGMSNAEIMNMAESGNIQAQYKIGLQLIGDYNSSEKRTAAQEDNIKRGVDFLTKAALQGNYEAMEKVGEVMYINGLYYAIYGGESTVNWFRKSAIMGCAEGMYGVGVLNIDDGNLENAMKWFIRSANYNPNNEMTESLFSVAAEGFRKGWTGKVDKKRAKRYETAYETYMRLLEYYNYTH